MMIIFNDIKDDIDMNKIITNVIKGDEFIYGKPHIV